MVLRLRRLLPTRPLCESLRSNAPPGFLAATLCSSKHSFSTSTSAAAKGRSKRLGVRDNYALRQIRQRKEANLSRQATLTEQRKREAGDPIRGIATPFVQSLDTVTARDFRQDLDATSIQAIRENPNEPALSPAQAFNEAYLNHGFSHEELGKFIKTSRLLTEPIPSGRTTEDPQQEGYFRRRWEAHNETATEAVQRILSLANGSHKSRTKRNIERIIGTFGRHNTDNALKPKAPAPIKHNPLASPPEPTPRIGPDTGSSEVQIGILTAKIRVLADRYEGENRNDKINKRNLRLMLHRRQKLLKYMEKKERGSERWHNMIKTLGLTPATWRGEIAL